LKLPGPVNAPLNVVLVPFLPTLSASAADAELATFSEPTPVNPPSVPAVSDPNDTAPLPLVSSVLFPRETELATTSVPTPTSVVPAYEFPFASVSIPSPVFVNPPGPESRPTSTTLKPAVSKVAPPPLDPSLIGCDVVHEPVARIEPLLKLK